MRWAAAARSWIRTVAGRVGRRVFIRERETEWIPPARPLRPLARPRVPDLGDAHPERMALLPYCVGRGLDIGCGHRKVAAHCIGVDVVAGGEAGRYGATAGRVSQADLCASGDDLGMFASDSLDYIVSSHNLEHYVDVVRALQEWRRVLRPGGVLAVIVPDERAGDTVFLDPTHKHAFTPESLVRLLQLIGFQIERVADVVRAWSFLVAARKGDAGETRPPGSSVEARRPPLEASGSASERAVQARDVAEHRPGDARVEGHVEDELGGPAQSDGATSGPVDHPRR